MRIQFCGADRTVTGSCHLLDVNGKRILLDLGMFQGPRDVAREFNQWMPCIKPFKSFNAALAAFTSP